MTAAAATGFEIRLAPWRSRFMLIALAASFVVLTGRAVYLQGLHNDFLQRKGESRYSRVIDITATRGMIVDRNNEPLAISTPVESVAASPADVEATPGQLAKLAKAVGMPVAELRKKLDDPDREFVYLRRQLPPEEAQKAAALGLPGIFLQREYRRYYPAGATMAHIVGFTNIDDKGQEGLELAFNDYLAGKPGSRRVIKDRLGHIVEDVAAIRQPEEGRDLKLSVDAKLQYLVSRELAQTVAEFRAKAGSIVVLDARTGEVLAMANAPSYNPNNRARLDPRRMRNRAVTDAFEPGSTLKPFTIAAALEAGVVTPDTRIETAPGTMRIGHRTIHDAHSHGLLTVAQVIQKSSNIGAAKMALMLKPEKLWRMFHSAGFGAPPHSGFPGEADGRVRPYATWRPIEQATMSYGHGISVSLLQLARAYTVFATGGVLLPVTFIKRTEPVVGTRIMSEATADAVRRMLEMVVHVGGTAPRAQVAGYRVAGKTGTAHKLEGGTYAPDKYISSFIGFAPASAPRLIIAVMIDEPSDGHYYGGTVAAPLFSRVMAAGLRMNGVAPDAPLDNVVLPPPNAPQVEEET